MSKWIYKINVTGIWKSDLAINEDSSEIAVKVFCDRIAIKLESSKRLLMKALERHYGCEMRADDEINELETYIDDIKNSKTVEDFNTAWDIIYTWADYNSIWIETRC